MINREFVRQVTDRRYEEPRKNDAMMAEVDFQFDYRKGLNGGSLS